MSSLQEAYESIGADYSDVLRRLMNEQLVARFVGKFLEDQTFAALDAAMAEQDVKQAFMAAHTLKGVCQNLGFANIYEPVWKLTEILRAESFEGAPELFDQVKDEYAKTINALKPCL